MGSRVKVSTAVVIFKTPVHVQTLAPHCRLKRRARETRNIRVSETNRKRPALTCVGSRRLECAATLFRCASVLHGCAKEKDEGRGMRDELRLLLLHPSSLLQGCIISSGRTYW